jgi:hypothetical protein|tara:strand:- start:1294 stop:3495 length:2202 start_codon:yes stop_codon:yes gene_type:complete
MTKKSTIARLLSEENINVVHKKADTASFNVETRELVLPIFKEEISNDVYDMFVCHEVGHALYTPMDLLERGVHQGINHSVINVLEDARIEKMFQKKYPGSVKNFKQGYKELVEGDFFKLKDKDLSKLNIIDKINIFYKTGLIGNVNEEEQKFIDEVDTLKSVEDVISLAARLSQYHKEQQKDQDGDDQQDQSGDQEQEETGSQSQSDQSESSEGQEQVQSSEGSEESEEKIDEGASESDSGEEESKDDSNNVGSQGAGLGNDGELKSSTDKAYQDAMNKNNDTDAKDRIYTQTPKKLNLNKLIYSHKEIADDLIETYTNKHNEAFDALIHEDYKKVFNDNKKVVQYMVKEFEMKKSADQYKRASTSKTGSLDMTKLHNYKFDEDLFAKMTTLPGATNHGMIMYLDWSGSMADNMRFTLIQLFNLIWFCQRVKIPYQVLAFTDRIHTSSLNEIQDEVVGDHNFQYLRLLEFFSSDQTKQQTQTMMTNLLGFTKEWVRDTNIYDPNHIFSTYVPRKYNLGGTPLNTALLTTYRVVKRFQEKHKVQKLNMVILTDGESHHHESVFSQRSNFWSNGDKELSKQLTYGDFGKDLYIQCSDTKVQTKLEYYHTESFLKFVRLQLPNISITGFYVSGTGKQGRVPLRDICRKFGLSEYSDKEKIVAVQKELREKKVAISKVAGFDEYYILPRGPRETDEEQELTFKKGARAAGMAREFLKFAQKKTLNRQLLNKFIEKVA